MNRESITDFFWKVVGDKREFRAYRKRTEALPEEYRIVLGEMEAYIWTFSRDASMDMLSDIVALFESASAEGKHVLDVTGSDVAEFCDGLLREWTIRTWTETRHDQLNESVHAKLRDRNV